MTIRPGIADFAVATSSDRADAAPPVVVGAFARADLPPGPRRSITLLIAASVLGHAAAVLALAGTPTPLASVGEHTITVEIVVGEDAPAGLGSKPNEEAADDSPAAAPALAALDQPTTDGVRERPERPVSPEPVPEQPREAAITPAEPMQASPPEPTATPEPETPAEAQPLDARKPVEVAIMAPAPPPDPDKPMEVAVAAPTQPPSTGSNSIGPGRSTGDPNYLGRIVAHLARHKRYPAEARNKRQKGKAVISFSLDGDGRVNSVKLVSGTGSRPLDQEATAMVQRASPFPRPPGGQPLTLTAPVSFSFTQ